MGNEREGMENGPKGMEKKGDSGNGFLSNVAGNPQGNQIYIPKNSK